MATQEAENPECLCGLWDHWPWSVKIGMGGQIAVGDNSKSTRTPKCVPPLRDVFTSPRLFNGNYEN